MAKVPSLDTPEVTEAILKKYQIKYLVWDDIPEHFEVSKDDIDARVWPADESEDDHKWIVQAYHEKGDPQWPNSPGFTIMNEKKNERHVFPDEIILHPEAVKRKLKLQYKGDDVDKIFGPKRDIEEAKKEKYKNPFTDRMCSYTYARNEGFIDKYGNRIPVKHMRFTNPDTGRDIGYWRAKQIGLIEDD